ncbi:asparaginyl-tRNA synthetase [Nematocida sp. AWRm77]|nr:asparaginyl-tRNA synthetase [Nematocida sp. AWRm77]
MHTEKECKEEQPVECRVKDITSELVGKRVSFKGWVYKIHTLKTKTFIDVYSAESTVKCVYALEKKIPLTKFTSVEIVGKVKPNFTRDVYDCEVHVEDIKVFGGVPAPTDLPYNEETKVDQLFEFGHLTIREPKRAAVMKVRAEILRIIREYYRTREYTEVTPPTLVQTQVEGGSTLFKLDYFGEPAFLTQSSQLYLETVAPVFGQVYCIASSYRAESSHTRRHLSEYTHVEAELAWISFEGLLSEIEDLIIALCRGFNEICVPILKKYKLDANEVPVPKKPFTRVSHREAIDHLNKIGFMKKAEDGSTSPYTYEDDIPDEPERQVCKDLGKGFPIFFTRFPAMMKSFYMEKSGNGLTDSCDLLYPGVGEIIGGSMRLWKHEELLQGFKNEGIDPAPYRFYTDQARYGPCPHGGYGLGLERILLGFMPTLINSVKMACLYPRYSGRCTP